MTIEIIAIVILILFSAYFSATETAFTSMSRIKLKTMAGDGNRKAQKVLDLGEKYDKLLTTILIGNNVVNITMTAIATLLFVELLADKGAAVSTVLITIIVLIFGEITPKNIAKERPESFAMFSAPMISFFMLILGPVNFVFTKWKEMVIKLFKLSSSNTITDDEILTMVEEAETGGGIDEERSELIQNAIEFDDLTAEEVMTPRPEIVAVDIETNLEDIEAVFEDTGFSRLPVYEEELDKIIGILNQKDFHYHVLGTDKQVSDYLIPALFVAETIKIFDLLRKMQQLKIHMAVVIDEYGGTAGIVTMEDMIEELVGEIYDEYDVMVNKEIMPLQNGSYRVRCGANIAKIFDYFDIDEEISEVNTVNGWVSMMLDHLPKKDDRFETVAGGKKLKVRVTKADDRKALEINLVVEDVAGDEEETERMKDKE